MIQFFKNNIEPRKKLRTAEIIVLIALVLGSIISLCVGLKEVHSNPGKVDYVQMKTIVQTTQYVMLHIVKVTNSLLFLILMKNIHS